MEIAKNIMVFAISITFIDDSIMKIKIYMIGSEHYIMKKAFSIIANALSVLLLAYIMTKKENFHHVNRKLHVRNYNFPHGNCKLHDGNYDFHHENPVLHDRTIKLYDRTI